MKGGEKNRHRGREDEAECSSRDRSSRARAIRSAFPRTMRSRPRGCFVTSPASSRTATCFCTAAKDMSYRPARVVTGGAADANIVRGNWAEADGEGAFFHSVADMDALHRVWHRLLGTGPGIVKIYLLYSEEHEAQDGMARMKARALHIIPSPDAGAHMIWTGICRFRGKRRIQVNSGSMPEDLGRLRDAAHFAQVAEADEGLCQLLDGLSDVARRVLRVPLAQVNVLMDGQQFSISSVAPGPSWAELNGPRAVPAGHSFCQHAIRSCEPLLIEDAATDPLVRDSPSMEMGIRAYAGIPLRNREGDAVATLCVVDSVPRAWNASDIEALSALADLLMREVRGRFSAQEALPGARNAADRSSRMEASSSP